MGTNLAEQDWRKPDQQAVAKNRPQADLRKLNEKFVQTLLKDFNRNGEQALEVFREKNPDKYCQLVASFMPKEQTLNVNAKSDVNHHHTHSLEHTARLLSEMTQGSDQKVIDAQPIRQQPDRTPEYDENAGDDDF